MWSVINKIGSINHLSFTAIIFGFLLFLPVATSNVVGQDVPPVFDLRFIGDGSPTAINNSGTVIGSRTVAGNYVPLVSTDGQPWTALPVPAGSMSTFPTDINNFNVIVGVSYSPQWNPVSVRWVAGTNGFTLEVLPRINNDPSSYATAINDAGQIVGSRSALGYQPTGQGWVYSHSNGFTSLASYGFWIVPRDINNAGVVIGGQERLNLVTGDLTLVFQDTGFAGIWPDDQFRINVVQWPRADGGRVVRRRSPDGGWMDWIEISAEDGWNTGPVWLDSSGKVRTES